MNFTGIFIRRPVFSICLSLVILLVGFIAFKQLSIREYPKMASGTITISTGFRGASADLIESFITTPLENAISGVSGVDTITSKSKAGKSYITINLKLNADIDKALNNVTSNVSAVLKKLPQGVDSPVIQKVDTDTSPDLIIGFSSSTRALAEMNEYLSRVVAPQLTNLPGVSAATVFGTRSYAMRVWLDPVKMAALNVTGAEIQNAIQDNNFQSTAGEIDRQWQSLVVTADTDLSTPEEFGRIVVKNKDHAVVRLHDVARVELGIENDKSSVYVNGKEAVAIAVYSKSDGNLLDMVKGVNQQLTQIKKSMPKDMQSFIARDTSTFVKSAIHKVNESIIEAVILVVLVVLLFIASFRSVVIPIVTIPLAVMGGFAFMLMMGYTINTLTLLAFILAIGLVVDDAIIVLENIHRHIESGLSPLQAAFKGAKEIGFAIVVMTLTLFSVFAPIGFTGGLTGALFREFAFTLAGMVLISGFIALTLSPMMCSRLLRSATSENRFEHAVNRILNRLSQAYRTGLTHVLQKNRVGVLLGVVIILIAGVMLIVPLNKKSVLIPTEDRGTFVAISSGPSGANVGYTEQHTQKLDAIFNTVPEKVMDINVNGLSEPNTALSFINLSDWSQRSRSTSDILAALTPKIKQLPDSFSTLLAAPSGIPGSKTTYPVELMINTTGSYAELDAVKQKFLTALQAYPGFVAVDADLKMDTPQVQVQINRDLALDLGISMRSIADAFSAALGQPQVSTFAINGQTYPVIPQLSAEHRENIDQLNNIYVKGTNQTAIPLSTIIRTTPVVGSLSLNHFQTQRAVKIGAALAPGYSMAQAIADMQKIAHNVLKKDMSYDYSGDTRAYFQATGSILTIFIFALIFIYLVLSAQFESFTDPLIVLFSVPLALVGALLAVLFSGSSLNIYTEIGLVTLIGLISKHGILIVEFANQRQAQGLSVKEAVIEAASIRLRPILMTTLAMVFGAIPMLFASGAGSQSLKQMGWVIVGGMSFGTVLTLFVVPTIYTFLARNRQKNRALSEME